MFKLNQSHLNATVMLNILKAIRESMTSAGNVAYVNNRKGQPFIKVKQVTEYLTKTNPVVRYLVTDSKGKNIRFDLGMVFAIRRSMANEANNYHINLVTFIQKHLSIKGLLNNAIIIK